MSNVAAINAKLLELNPILETLAERSTPFLDMIRSSDPFTNNTKAEWSDKNLVTLYDALSAAITSTTQTTLTLASGTTTGRARYTAGRTIIDINDERMLVASIITVQTNYVSVNITRAQDSTTTIGEAGVGQVVECGPGKVLAGLTKRIDDQLQGMALMDEASLMEVMQTLKS